MQSQPDEVSGIYIHTPFCRKKCSYCDFYSEETGTEELITKYVDTVVTELQNRWIEISDSKTVSVYIGGGSPSLLNEKSFETIHSFLKDKKLFDSYIEFTVELNPGDINEKLIETLKNSGVNRISLGVQSYDDDVLNEMGRTSKKKDIDNALFLIDRSFDNYSIDIIYGIGKNRDLTNELRHLFDLSSPSHLSAYSYTVPDKPGCPAPLSEDDVFKHESEIKEFLDRKGLKQYEVSNYSLPDKKSIHNMIYWKYQTWLGIGAGAYSFIRKNREHSFYPEDIEGFLNGSDLSRYNPSLREQMEEFLLMGLRIVEGADLDQFLLLFRNGFEDVFDSERTDALIHNGFCLKNERYLKCTEKGLTYLNYVLRELFDSFKGSFNDR